MQIANFINGEFVPPRSGEYFDDINPATAEVIATIPDSDERDVDDAVRAAKAAFPAWSRRSTAERSNLLLKLADLIEKNLDELARLESIDNGKNDLAARSAWTSRAPSPTSASSPPPSFTSPATRTSWTRPRSTTRCASRSAWSV